MTSEKRYQIALSLISGIGPVLSKQLLNHFGTPENIFQASKGSIAKVEGIGAKLSRLLSNQDTLLKQADAIIEGSAKAEVEIHFYKDLSYPKRLLNISDAPLILYSRGKTNLNPLKSIGIVGTRKSTKYGADTTEKIMASARSNEPTIFSGLAYGIDIKAHEEALKQDLPTIGVLACGLDQVYPAGNRPIARKMLNNGGLISEYPVGTKADPRFFPARNRIIAGLSDALIIVEAAKKGGALITGNLAHGYDKPVFAVPGQLDKSNSAGCNQLIKTMKATIYTDFQDVVEALNWDISEPERLTVLTSKLERLTGREKTVVDTMLKNNQQMSIDDLSWQSQIPLNQLASILLQLEFEGLVTPLPGKEFRLCS
ncbi:DNA-processing protein DprA [Roseivirga misakiensis]|uniref:DNA protecting protein DprA n=1 Tax=Roseivirga misakiensis TaxID=1563681 RepID=A0A1E5T0G5_9BACT|nr:DNA-processing protein DprA [Roseivirga misakiensis]OEK04845.1 DNA protecting protein DprA [Roseivirga misakiensis]